MKFTRCWKPILLLVLLAVCSSYALPQQLDEYGGVKGARCSNSSHSFQTKKIENQWWFCDPAGNLFFMTGVYVVAPSQDLDERGGSYYQRIAKKYGDNGPRWAEAENRRLKSWGFNTLGPYSSPYTLPTHKENVFSGDRSQPVKMPFISIVRPAFYSMTNSNSYLAQGSAVKNMLYGKSPFYTGYAPGPGVADYFDDGIGRWLRSALEKDASFNEIRSSEYRRYMIGMNCDDSDQMYGFGAGDAFETDPPGHNNNHLGWIVATMSPLQTANRDKSQIYSSAVVFSKQAWAEHLKTKYGSIDNLNRAWGANYSSFESSGKVIRGEQIAKANGQTRAFYFTLQGPRISRFSLALALNGKIVGGDTGDGRIFGPEIDASSSIDYTSGKGALVFQEGHTPVAGSAISADYVLSGWAIGSGVLDEDGRPTHRKWLGEDFLSLKDSAPAVRADLNEFLQLIASHYFRTCSEGIKAEFPGTLYLGPDTLGTWGAPPRAEVLGAAAQFIDAMAVAGRSSFTTSMIDYVRKNFGDKPLYEGEFRAANPDSALFRYPNPSDVGIFNTQAERGESYFDVVSKLQSKSDSLGASHPYVGTLWWQFVDNLPEKLDWGLVTPSDNAYDGNEARREMGKDAFGFATGGEERDYGDALSAVKRANLQWIQNAVKASDNAR